MLDPLAAIAAIVEHVRSGEINEAEAHCETQYEDGRLEMLTVTVRKFPKLDPIETDG